jgi:hypothetical protein
MASSIESVFMVEASPELREKQKALLCGPDAPSSESKSGYHATSKYGGIPVVWTETIKSIPIGEALPPSLLPTDPILTLLHRRYQQGPFHRGS